MGIKWSVTSSEPIGISIYYTSWEKCNRWISSGFRWWARSSNQVPYVSRGLSKDSISSWYSQDKVEDLSFYLICFYKNWIELKIGLFFRGGGCWLFFYVWCINLIDLLTRYSNVHYISNINLRQHFHKPL